MWGLHWINKLMTMPSSVIHSFEYDVDGGQLIIEFQSGLRYVYFDVPPELHAGLQRAPSRGAYFNQRIRDRYSYSRLDALRDAG